MQLGFCRFRATRFELDANNDLAPAGAEIRDGVSEIVIGAEPVEKVDAAIECVQHVGLVQLAAHVSGKPEPANWAEGAESRRGLNLCIHGLDKEQTPRQVRTATIGANRKLTHTFQRRLGLTSPSNCENCQSKNKA